MLDGLLLALWPIAAYAGLFFGMKKQNDGIYKLLAKQIAANTTAINDMRAAFERLLAERAEGK
jgi:hypothetical protein